MLDKAKPDGAIVATPNQMHVAVGLACIARKIPILDREADRRFASPMA